jgi:iron-sulfur cluster repair protein YtfE (RIC family)
MSTLIEGLKKDHASVVEVLNEVKEHGIGSKTGRDHLLSARAALLAHLKVEDEQLYPVLREEAEANDALKRTLDLFARDMETVSKQALGFFEKYSSGGSGLEFAKDYGRLHAALGQRMSREEKILYPEYEKLNR